jgi:hypothetical protein
VPCIEASLLPGHEDHWEAGADANDVLDIDARHRGEPGMRISM